MTFYFVFTGFAPNNFSNPLGTFLGIIQVSNRASESAIRAKAAKAFNLVDPDTIERIRIFKEVSRAS